MKIFRVIHPVGQGAFYTERIVDENSGDTMSLVVYDCGTNSAIRYLYESIDNYFDENDIIDILFVSHFDRDHINGISKLKSKIKSIKNVVIPLVESEDMWIFKLGHDPDIEKAINGDTEFYGAHKIIKVASKDIEAESDSTIGDIIEVGNLESTVNSGTIIRLNGWYYIPYNYKVIERKNILEKEFRDNGIDLTKIAQWDTEYMSSNSHIINKIYAKVSSEGTSNYASLIVYSGMIDGSRHINIFNNGDNSFCRYLQDISYCDYREGCLYLGDMKLSQPNLIGDLVRSLSQFTNHISTIQLPHHGALKEYCSDICSLGGERKIFFASFGLTNQYKHPSVKVIEDILQRGYIFKAVTENKSSALIQIIIVAHCKFPVGRK